MGFVCVRCADQKVTTKLLGKQVLNTDVGNLISSFTRCKGCDGQENAVKFKTTMKKLPAFSFPWSVQLAKKMLRDKHLKKIHKPFYIDFFEMVQI